MKKNQTISINRGDWSGRNIEITVFEDESFSIYGNRYWFSKESDEEVPYHFEPIPEEQKKCFTSEYLDKRKNILITEENEEDIREQDFCFHVYGEDSKFSFCSVIKIDDIWMATAHGGDVIRESPDKLTATVQLLCNII